MRQFRVSLVTCLLILAAGLPAGDLHGEEMPVVAIFDMEDKGSMLDPKVLDNLTEYLAARLTEGGYMVIPRDQIRTRLRGEKQASFKACYDQSCQIELGRELAAQNILATKILRIGDTCQLTAILFDLKKSTTVRAATAEAACHENSLLVAVRKVATSLCEVGVAKRTEPSEFDKFMQEVKHDESEKERAKRAWEIIRRIATDPKESSERRVTALKKFMEEFNDRPNYIREARKLLAELVPGTLIVSTYPKGARILLGGQAVAKAPYTMELKAGEYQVMASLGGYVEETKTVSVRPGAQTSVSFSLKKIEPGTLVIHTEPEGALVSVEGVPDGKSPLTKKLMPGRYNLRVSHEGYWPAKWWTTVNPGRETKLTLSLKEIPPDYETWGEVMTSIGLGMLTLAVGSAYMASSTASDYSDEGDYDAQDRSRTWAAVMWVSMGTGLAVSITGLILWSLAEEPPPGADNTAMGLVPTEGGLVFSVGGSF